jgi:sugar phosphate isomerase/epimerase
MIKFTTTLKKFDDQGEKTGWTYIEICNDKAEKLKPNNKKAFRVKGKLDSYEIKGVAVMPMGDGTFVLPFNAAMRKGTGKRKGEKVTVYIQEDTDEMEYNADMMECIADEPQAKANFEKMSKGMQRYFSNWITSAKTEETKAKRIAQTVNALVLGQDYGQMIRALKAAKDKMNGM